jgi:hypothetical protein
VVVGSGTADPGRIIGRFSEPRTLMYPPVHPLFGLRASTKIDLLKGMGKVLNQPPTAAFFPHMPPAEYKPVGCIREANAIPHIIAGWNAMEGNSSPST